jgi:hypothetical protein
MGSKFDNQPDLQEIFTRAAFREISNGHHASADRLFIAAGIALDASNLRHFFTKLNSNHAYDIPPSPAERPMTYSFVDFMDAVHTQNYRKAFELARDLQFDREKAREYFIFLDLKIGIAP